MADRVEITQYSSNNKCEVCGGKIGYSDFLLQKKQHFLVCNSFECKRMMSQKSTMAPEVFKYHLQFKKKLIRQEKEQDAALKKYIGEIEAWELQENQKILQFTLDGNTELVKESIYLVSIPSGLSKLVLLPKKRVEIYAEHLKKVISQAAKYDNASKVTEEIFDENADAHEKHLKVEETLSRNPVLRTISDQLCFMCKGGCCAAGENNAYLSVVSIRHYMDVNPGLSEQDLLDLYLSKIDTETVENACINQTKTGCSLTREMRSDICNGYYCGSLKSLQKKHADNAEIEQILVVQRSNTNWDRFNTEESHKVINVTLIREDKFQQIGWSSETKIEKLM